MINFTTFNIQHARNYITKVIDFEKVCETIKNTNGEIICLNEVFGDGSNDFYRDQAKIIAQKLGMNYYFGKAINVYKNNEFVGNYGNAILSKYEIENPEVIKIPDPEIKNENVYYESRVIIKAKIKGCYCFALHMGLAKQEQKNAVQTLIENIKNLKEPFVIMGDFNMTPNDTIISPLFKYVNDTSSFLNDVIKATFPSDNPKIKIDYILASKNIKILESKIINIITSDHLPVTAKLEY